MVPKRVVKFFPSSYLPLHLLIQMTSKYIGITEAALWKTYSSSSPFFILLRQYNTNTCKIVKIYDKIQSFHFFTLFVPPTQSLKFENAVNFGTFLSPFNTTPPVAGFRYSRASSFFLENFPKPEIDTVLSLDTACVMSWRATYIMLYMTRVNNQ